VAIEVNVETRRQRVESFLHVIEPRVDPVEASIREPR